MVGAALFGLVLSLVGAPVLLWACRRAGLEHFGLASRLGLWALAAAALAIAVSFVDGWPLALGLSAEVPHSILQGGVAALLVLAGWPLAGIVQRLLGGQSTATTAQFQELAALPSSYRLFLVITAGVTEEILYRGYGIGVGRGIVGSQEVALGLSLVAFVAAHFRWGVGHLISVTWAGLVLSMLFMLTNSLLACIVAHVIVDAVGLLLAPWAMSKRSARGVPGK